MERLYGDGDGVREREGVYAGPPLLRSMSATLAEHDVQVHEQWVEVVGAVIGRDDDAIRAGVAATLNVDEGTAAFFPRLQLDTLSVQSAMLILRQCGVPKMNYALRCMPPPCVEQQATTFDELVMDAARSKLLLHVDEVQQPLAKQLLRAPLRHGGFGLTSAITTSPAAYLGSVAAVSAASAAPAFVPYSQPDCVLPSSSLLHGWIEGSMRAIVDATPECQQLLPPTASTFFQRFRPVSASSRIEVSFVLQHQLSLQATASTHQASLQRARAMKKTDGGVTVARLVSVSAPRAWAWKSVQPTSRELALTDVQYRIAARLNLSLQPVQAAAMLPDVCVLCADQNRNSIRRDPWHFLSCRALSRGEVNLRHNDVGRALYRCALLMGIRAQLEPRGLDGSSHLRPDLLLTLPGRQILSDVAVIHPLTAGAVVRGHGRSQLGSARRIEGAKRRKYTDISSQRQFELMPFGCETTGGLGPSAVQLIRVMAQASAELLHMWSYDDIVRELVGSVAIAVQRGGAMAYLEGYDRTVHVGVGRKAAVSGPVAAAVAAETESEGEGEGEE